MRSYYFTFGYGAGHPFNGGWIIVKSQNIEIAQRIYQLYFPDKSDSNELNCSMIYTENEFKRTQMYKNGNYGKRCHGIIEYKQFKQKAV